MPEVFDCRFQLGDGGSVESAHAEIPDDEWAVVEEFLGHAERLFNSPAAEIGVSFQLHWNSQSGFSYTGELPHDDQIAAILHRLRPFILQKESTYLAKVCGVLAHRIEHPQFRKMMKGILNEFMGKSFQQQMKVTVGNATLNTDEMVKNWLNGFEYHHFEDARQALEVFNTVLPEGWQRAIFISMLIDKAREVGNTLIIVRWLLHRDNEPFKIGQ